MREKEVYSKLLASWISQLEEGPDFCGDKAPGEPVDLAPIPVFFCQVS